MFVMLPLFCFFVFVVIYAATSSEPGPLTRWRVSFVAGALTWGVALTAMTELLSLFRLITFEWLLSCWLGVTLLAVFTGVAVSTKEKVLSLSRLPSLPRFELACLAGVASVA